MLSSQLMYGTNNKRKARICEVPRKVVTDGYLMFLTKRGEQVGIALMNNEEWAECQERCQTAAMKELGSRCLPRAGQTALKDIKEIHDDSKDYAALFPSGPS